jgi:hypothetical protein
MPSMEKNPDFFARYLSVWCWTCGRVTTHEITFRWGGRCFLCKECANIVVEKL